jgi:hypothetical protein
MRSAFARFLGPPRLVRVLWILAALLAVDVLLRVA